MPRRTTTPRTRAPREHPLERGREETVRRARRVAEEDAAEPGASWRSGFGGLLRGGGGVLGQISGMDGPARSLDRLAASAEHAAALLDRLEEEIGIERVLETLDRLDGAVDLLEEIRDHSAETSRALHSIEQRIGAELRRPGRSPSRTPRGSGRGL